MFMPQMVERQHQTLCDLYNKMRMHVIEIFTSEELLGAAIGTKSDLINVVGFIPRQSVVGSQSPLLFDTLVPHSSCQEATEQAVGTHAGATDPHYVPVDA